MLTLLSPAKNLDFEGDSRGLPASVPELLSDTAALMKKAKSLRKSEIRRLMGISDQLVDLNFERFQALRPETNEAEDRHAVLAFRGDVYMGLDAETLRKQDLVWAQDHLRILSGLYGLLKPFDLIQPYRLTMGTELKTRRGKDLYAFWGSRIADNINATLAGETDPVVVNLASDEYFKSVGEKRLKARVVTPVFKEVKDGRSMVMSFVAKRSRGLLARWIIENRIDEPERIREFDVEDYRFDPEGSNEGRFEFVRKFVSRAAA